jgi:hypothetical protein
MIRIINITTNTDSSHRRAAATPLAARAARAAAARRGAGGRARARARCCFGALRYAQAYFLKNRPSSHRPGQF